MATILELAKAGKSYMRRPCWEGNPTLEINFDNQILSENGTLWMGSDIKGPIPLGPFIEYNDFEAVNKPRRKSNGSSRKRQ